MDLTSPVHRRTLLAGALAGGLTFGWDLAPAQARPRRRVPRTLHDVGPVGTVRRPGFAVHHVGITWSGPASPGRLRLHDAHGWRDGPRVSPTDVGADPPHRHASLVYVGAYDAYELVPAAGVSEVEVHAINTVDGPGSRQAPDRMRQRLGCRYLSRAGWGADESLRFEPDGTEIFPPAYFDVQTLTVHHTVTLNRDPDPAATVRAIYFFQAVTQTWGDLGYHLLIDEAGLVYEGRWSGTDGTPVFGPLPAGQDLSMVNAAHVAGFNAGNVGVALLGDLTATGPTPAARRSLVTVLAVLARLTGLDPLGRTEYVNPISGATRTVPTVAGHRDWAATECPGNMFSALLPALRADVALIMT